MTHAYMIAKLLKALMDNDLSKSELARETGLHHVTVARYVHALHRERVIFVSDWTQGLRGPQVARYGLNIADEKDVPRPLLDSTRKYKDYRKRRAMKAAIQMTAGSVA